MKCRPALTNTDHKRRFGQSSPVIPKSRASLMPVAHPGCPEDHFQTYANRSPGDLINDAQKYRQIIFALYGFISIPSERSGKAFEKFTSVVGNISADNCNIRKYCRHFFIRCPAGFAKKIISRYFNRLFWI